MLSCIILKERSHKSIEQITEQFLCLCVFFPKFFVVNLLEMKGRVGAEFSLK